MMNKISSIALIMLTILIAGCKQEKVDVSKLIAERDSIKEASMQQKQELDNLNSFVEAVSNGLDSIAMQERFVRSGNPEGGPMTRTQMQQSLAELAKMLDRQRNRIAQLQDSLKIKGSGADGLRNIVAHLNEQLNAKEQLIKQLRNEVANKNTNIAHLQTRISSLNDDVDRLDKKTKLQHQALVTQSDMMNECYMKIGSKKQLKEAGILTSGGLFKKSQLDSRGLTQDKFVRVDIRQFREIQIRSKKPKILTTMPQSSYTIIRNADGTSTLKINDPTAFWRSSNYLVIQTD